MDKFQAKYNPENIIVVPGSKIAFYSIFKIFKGSIYIPSPCWVSYPKQCDILNKKYITY